MNSKNTFKVFSPNFFACLVIVQFACSSTQTSTKKEIQAKQNIQKPDHEEIHHAPAKTVKGMMQARPGGPIEEVEVGVHEVPTDLPIVKVNEANLNDNDLVLGVITNGTAVAFPIRFLAMYEVVDSKVGKLPVAPTW